MKRNMSSKVGGEGDPRNGPTRGHRGSESFLSIGHFINWPVQCDVPAGTWATFLGIPGSAGHAGVSHFVATIPVIRLLGVSSAPLTPYKSEG